MNRAAVGILVTGFFAAALGSAFAASQTSAKAGEWYGNSVVQVRQRTASEPSANRSASRSSSNSTSHRTSSRSYRLRTFTGDVISIGRDNVRVMVGRYIYLVRNPNRARITVPGVARASVSDIAVGDRVKVSAYRIGTGIYSPRSIRVVAAEDLGTGRGPSQFPQRFSFVGAVSEINPSSRTLTVRTIGARTYHVDASKASILHHGRPSGFGSLKVGDSVRVRGSLKDSTVFAENINEITAGYVGQPTALIGVLSSVNASERNLVISRANRLITVDVPQSVAVLMHGQPIRLSSIPEGATIKVKGRWINSSTVDATYVEVFPPK